MNPIQAAGGIGGILAALLILDLFFLGVILPVEEPVFEMMAEALSS